MNDAAKELWDDGKGYEAGALLFTDIENSKAPGWASRILELIVEKMGISHPILDEVYECASNPSRWHDGHRVFERIRNQVLVLDEHLRQQKSSEMESLNHVLGLGELVAKVSYNATDPPDAFDEDSGYWIVAMAKGFANVANDRAFEQEIWTAVASVG